MAAETKLDDARMLVPLGPMPLESNWDGVVEDASLVPTLLIVDELDLNRRLLRALLKNASYHILEAKRPSEAFAVLDREKVDLVIADQVLPEMNGIEFCRLVKNERRTQLIPVLMTTSVQGMDNEVACLESGVDEFLIKPLRPALVRTRIRAMLRKKALIDSLEEAETILFALAQSVEHRDRYTGQHCERLAAFGVTLAQAVGLSRRDQVALYRGGYLHDIGKIAIPDAILFKRGLLTDEEWRIMRQHTIRGEEICRPMKTLAPVLPIIRSHHERWDGSGYPDGLRGEDIPLLARILQVADIYDALTTARPYKPAFSHAHAIEMMAEEVRRGWRDPELVSLFAEVVERSAAPGETRLEGGEEMQSSLVNLRRGIAR